MSSTVIDYQCVVWDDGSGSVSAFLTVLLEQFVHRLDVSTADVLYENNQKLSVFPKFYFRGRIWKLFEDRLGTPPAPRRRSCLLIQPSSLTKSSISRHCPAKNAFCNGRMNGMATCSCSRDIGGGHETIKAWRIRAAPPSSWPHSARARPPLHRGPPTRAVSSPTAPRPSQATFHRALNTRNRDSALHSAPPPCNSRGKQLNKPKTHPDRLSC